VIPPAVDLFWLLVAAIWALTGTNAQARGARRQAANDSDSDIAAALAMWRPIPWLARRERRAQMHQLESQIEQDAGRWSRYVDLRADLRAWNALESSVALAAAAALDGLVKSVFGWV
jgi:hypothetical protein